MEVFDDGGVFFYSTARAAALVAPPAPPAEAITTTGAEPPLAQAFKEKVLEVLLESPASSAPLLVCKLFINIVVAVPLGYVSL
ncbi:hypothetical protein ACFXTO_028929 [Malus domestica]